MTRTVDNLGTWALLGVLLLAIFHVYGWHVLLWTSGALFCMAVGGQALIPERKDDDEG